MHTWRKYCIIQRWTKKFIYTSTLWIILHSTAYILLLVILYTMCQRFMKPRKLISSIDYYYDIPVESGEHREESSLQLHGCGWWQQCGQDEEWVEESAAFPELCSHTLQKQWIFQHLMLLLIIKKILIYITYPLPHNHSRRVNAESSPGILDADHLHTFNCCRLNKSAQNMCWRILNVILAIICIRQVPLASVKRKECCIMKNDSCLSLHT